MIRAIKGYPRNKPNPNTDGMRSGYKAEEVEEVKGEKAASRDANKEEGALVGIQWTCLGQGQSLWSGRKENYDPEHYLVGDLMCYITEKSIQFLTQNPPEASCCL